MGLVYTLLAMPALAQNTQSEVVVVTEMPSLDEYGNTETFVNRYSSVMEYEAVQEQQKTQRFAGEIREFTSGYPIEHMASAIAEQDRVVAAYLVGIARKESSWGKHAPHKGGEDCYNYWGYKGEGSRGFALGYGCYASPEEAVSIVGARIHTLAVEQKRETPREMLIWKCGSSCETHDPAGVEKWVSDVEKYYRIILDWEETGWENTWHA